MAQAEIASQNPDNLSFPPINDTSNTSGEGPSVITEEKSERLLNVRGALGEFLNKKVETASSSVQAMVACTLLRDDPEYIHEWNTLRDAVVKKFGENSKEVRRFDKSKGRTSPADPDRMNAILESAGEGNWGNPNVTARLADAATIIRDNGYIRTFGNEVATPAFQSRVRGTLTRLAIDMTIDSVGANAMMPVAAGLLWHFGGPAAAASYATLEAGLTAVPLVPGLPGWIRFLRFSIARGVTDGVRRYESMKKSGENVQLAKCIVRSVVVGIPASFDYGYLLEPVIALARMAHTEIPTSAINRIRKNISIMKMLQKFGLTDELQALYPRLGLAKVEPTSKD